MITSDKIRIACIEHKISQQELAEKSGYNRQHVSKSLSDNKFTKKMLVAFESVLDTDFGSELIK